MSLKDINVQQVKDLRSKLESDIKALIENFESETNCSIHAVNLDQVDLLAGQSRVVGVRIDVVLDRQPGGLQIRATR